jgi:hypothetical protein
VLAANVRAVGPRVREDKAALVADRRLGRHAPLSDVADLRLDGERLLDRDRREVADLEAGRDCGADRDAGDLRARLVEESGHETAVRHPGCALVALRDDVPRLEPLALAAPVEVDAVDRQRAAPAERVVVGPGQGPIISRRRARSYAVVPPSDW